MDTFIQYVMSLKLPLSSLNPSSLQIFPTYEAQWHQIFCTCCERAFGHLDTDGFGMFLIWVSIVNHLTSSEILQERKNIQILRIIEIAEGRVTHDIQKVTKSVAYVKAEK